MTPNDMSFIEDPVFRAQCEIYAKDEDLFFKDFSKAYMKLTELGCPGLQYSWGEWIFGA